VTSTELPPAASRRELLDRSDLTLSSAFVPADGDTQRRLLAIWENVLEIRGLGVDDDFFEIDGRSLSAVTLFTEIEHVFGRIPPVSILLNCPTVRKLAARLDALHTPAHDSLVMPVRPQGRLAPLFFSHAAWGNVLFVRRLVPYLDPDRPVFAIQARGLRESETPHRDFASMAADYVSQIQTVQPKGPYYLAGNCAGALIAFEMAQRLRALGEEVRAVVMVDPENNPHAVPWLHWRNPDAWHMGPWKFVVRLVWAVRHRFRKMYHRFTGGRPVRSITVITGPERERREAIHSGVKAAVLAFRPRSYDGKLTIVCCANRLKSLSNPITGWPSLSRQVEFVEVGGDHDDVFNDALPEVGATIERVIRQSDRESVLGEDAA
jgi:Thioesterase domain/Phosphopantetheine attachment site